MKDTAINENCVSTMRIQQPRYSKMSFCNVEGLVQPLHVGVSVESFKVYQPSLNIVDEQVEGIAVSPARTKVLDFHLGSTGHRAEGNKEMVNCEWWW